MLEECGDEPNYLLFRGRAAYVILNLFPYTSGHLLVVANRHIPSLSEASSAELHEILPLKMHAPLRTADVRASIASLFATGRYREAVKFLRSAFELQPRIAYLNYDMRKDYRRSDDFERQAAALDQSSTAGTKRSHCSFFGSTSDGMPSGANAVTMPTAESTSAPL